MMMEDLSLHILDLVENATNAEATLVEIHVTEDSHSNLFQIRIRDNGRGMDEKMSAKARDPFVTTRRTRRIGLGLPLIAQAAREACGDLMIHSKPGEGTEVTVTFQANHIDRKPVGDIGATLVSLVAGHPNVDFLYISDFDGEKTVLDTREIRAQLDGATTLNDPAVLQLIRDLFRKTPGDDQASNGGNNHG